MEIAGTLVLRSLLSVDSPKAARMKFWSWLLEQISPRARVLAVYRSGMEKANSHDHAGAIADYTSIAENPDAPPDLVAIAVYNRALAYSACSKVDKAILDLQLVGEMSAAPTAVRTEARRRLLRLKRRSDQPDDLAGEDHEN